MPVLDIHTHHLPAVPSQSIQNCFPETFCPHAGSFYSVGLHPWYLKKETLEQQWQSLLDALRHPQVVALGEAGLDRLADTAMELQLEAFGRQIRLCEERDYPLVIHAVRVMDEMLRLKKEYRPQVPWIIHGFRGKKEQAMQFLRQGFYLSFGEKFQEEALRVTPADRLFFETDESRTDIHRIYEHAAVVRGVSAAELIRQIQENVKAVFPRVGNDMERRSPQITRIDTD